MKVSSFVAMAFIFILTQRLLMAGDFGGVNAEEDCLNESRNDLSSPNTAWLGFVVIFPNMALTLVNGAEQLGLIAKERADSERQIIKISDNCTIF